MALIKNYRCDLCGSILKDATHMHGIERNPEGDGIVLCVPFGCDRHICNDCLRSIRSLEIDPSLIDQVTEELEP